MVGFLNYWYKKKNFLKYNCLIVLTESKQVVMNQNDGVRCFYSSVINNNNLQNYLYPKKNELLEIVKKSIKYHS